MATVSLVGNGSGRDHDEGVSPGGDVEVAGVGAKVDVGDDRSDIGEFLTGGDKVDIEWSDARGLVDEAQGYLA